MTARLQALLASVSDLLSSSRELVTPAAKPAKLSAYLVSDVARLKSYLLMDDYGKGYEIAWAAWPLFVQWAEETQPESIEVDALNVHDRDSREDQLGLDMIPEETLAEFWRWFSADSSQLERFVPPAEQPTFLYMEFSRIVKNEWLVHFSKDAGSIAVKGFRYGIDDITTLGLTTHFVKKTGPGFNFAYLADDATRYGRGRRGDWKYGNHAVMFRANGVKVWHYTDEEPQVIFLGSTAKDIVELENRDGVWAVIGNDNEPVFQARKLDRCVEWVETNYDQYRNKLAQQRPVLKPKAQKLAARNIQLETEGVELSAAKADDYKAKYPELADAIDVVVEADPTSQKKYLDWSVGQLRKGADASELAEAVKQYDAALPRLRGKDRDLNGFKTVADMKAATARGEQAETRGDVKKKAKKGGVILYEDERWKLVHPVTMDGSIYWGSNTSWCVSRRDKENNYFYRYVGSNNVNFYFLIDEQAEVYTEELARSKQGYHFSKLAILYESGKPYVSERYQDATNRRPQRSELEARYTKEFLDRMLDIAEKHALKHKQTWAYELLNTSDAATFEKLYDEHASELEHLPDVTQKVFKLGSPQMLKKELERLLEQGDLTPSSSAVLSKLAVETKDPEVLSLIVEAALRHGDEKSVTWRLVLEKVLENRKDISEELLVNIAGTVAGWTTLLGFTASGTGGDLMSVLMRRSDFWESRKAIEAAMNNTVDGRLSSLKMLCSNKCPTDVFMEIVGRNRFPSPTWMRVLKSRNNLTERELSWVLDQEEMHNELIDDGDSFTDLVDLLTDVPAAQLPDSIALRLINRIGSSPGSSKRGSAAVRALRTLSKSSKTSPAILETIFDRYVDVPNWGLLQASCLEAMARNENSSPELLDRLFEKAKEQGLHLDNDSGVSFFVVLAFNKNLKPETFDKIVELKYPNQPLDSHISNFLSLLEVPTLSPAQIDKVRSAMLKEFDDAKQQDPLWTVGNDKLWNARRQELVNRIDGTVARNNQTVAVRKKLIDEGVGLSVLMRSLSSQRGQDSIAPVSEVLEYLMRRALENPDLAFWALDALKDQTLRALIGGFSTDFLEKLADPDSWQHGDGKMRSYAEEVMHRIGLILDAKRADL